MSTADERIGAMLCRWAEARYELQDVTRVDFGLDQRGPYSDFTPDIDAYVEVSVWTAERERLRAEQIHSRPPVRWIEPYEFEEHYSGELIKDILRFVVS